MTYSEVWFKRDLRVVDRDHLAITIEVGAEFDIPEPLVDLQTATHESKAKLFGLRAPPEVKADKAAIVEKHASRAKKLTTATRRKKSASESVSL